MPQFLVIVRDHPGDFTELSPEEMQQVVERYMAWTQKMHDEGRIVLSHKLRDGEGRVVRGAGATDGPFAEGKEIVGGFWVINADDLDDATEALRDHPHKDSAGSLEIREIEVLPGR